MMWPLVVSMAFWACFIFSFSFAQQSVSVEEIVAKAAEVNRFWLTLPYEDVSLTYQFIVHGWDKPEPAYIAWVAFKAPDKARLQELKRWRDKDELLTVIYNKGEFGIISPQKITRTEQFGLSVREPLIAVKMAFQFFPPSRYFFANPKDFSVHLLGKEAINGREVWVVEAKGRFGGHLGRGVGMHITFGGSSFGGDTLRLYVDCRTYALLKEVTISKGKPRETLEYADYRPLGSHLVPMVILWKSVSLSREREFIDRIEMQIVDGKVWMLKQVFAVGEGKIVAEVRDAHLTPLGDRLFDLPQVEEKPAPKQEEVTTLSLSGKHFRVSYPKALEAYAKAFIQIGDAAWEAYRELYNLPLPEPVTLQISLTPERGEHFARLWNDGQRFIFLEVGSEKPLLSPTKGGAHNVYGICHELGHIAIYHRMSQVAGMPEGIGEGWAYYFGSVITSYLFEKLGAQVYPDPHNYHETSGMARLLRQLETGHNPKTLAAKILYDVERKYGRRVLGEVLNRTLAQRPSGHELVAKFVEALVAVTNDPQARSLIPEQFLSITQKRLYYGLKMEWREGLLQLRYDDGEKDGQWSIAGSGHGIIFVKPEGKWQLVAVEFYGARYGALQPPDEDFSIFLCDANFNVIREFKAPYSLFAQRGEWKWERISVEPTEVPEFFYIVIAFNPTATKGIYMAYDTDVPRSHSRKAFPNSHLMDTEKTYDWMIRCYLKPADEQTAANAQELIKRLQSELEMPKKGTTEPYPDDPVEVARKFMESLLSGKEQALAFSDEQLHQRVMEDLDYFGRFKDNPPRLLHARLAQRNERHDFFSRMAKRVVEIWKRGEICVAVWYAFPPFNQADTWFVALRKVNGQWQVSSFGTWGYAVPIPTNARGVEVEKAFLKNVQWTGITDYSALGKAYYAPLPEDLAEAEKVVRQVLEYWQAGNDAAVLKLMHPKSKVTAGSNLTKFATAQKQARTKMRGMKLVGLTAYRDTIVQGEQPDEFSSLENSLTELFGMSPEGALGVRWLYARIAIFDAEFSDGKQSIKVRLFAIKEGNRWLLANLPM